MSTTSSVSTILPPPAALPPLRAALGDALDGAAPAVRRHFSQAAGTRVYRGVFRRVWVAPGLRGALARPALWLCRRAGMFLADAGTDVPFSLSHVVTDRGDGYAEMTWARELHFPGGVRRIEGAITFDPARGTPVEWMGRGRWLEAELHCRVEGGTLYVASGHQWLHLAGRRVPLPPLLAGRADLREWQQDDGTLGTRLVVSSPLLGEIIGWEGTFREDETATADAPSPDARVTDSRAIRTRLLLGAVAVLGTLAYSLSFLPAAGGRFVGPGAAIGVAAGVSWFVLGAAVLWMSRGRPSIGAWADACLATMAVGIGLLSAGTILNLAAWGVPAVGSAPEALAAAHLAILLASNIAMGATFVRRAGRLGLSAVCGTGAWVLALDGTFAIILLCLARYGGLIP
jgi:hypothetical protein